jgi:uncharacterized membrane protein
VFLSRFLTAEPADQRGFRFRSREVSRLEAFSDCVFAFALTLIVVALEVPKTVEHLFAIMKVFPVFAVCFATLLNVWWVHHRFFRRYAINDLVVFVLNGVLLFTVLFYVYPLRFLFGLLFAVDTRTAINVEQGRDMFTIYGGGFAAVYLTFALMHVHAWRLREHLALDELERWMTLETIAHHTALACVGLLSVAIARFAPPPEIQFAGWIFFVIPIPLTIVGWLFGKRIRARERPGPRIAD